MIELLNGQKGGVRKNFYSDSDLISNLFEERL